MSTRYRSEDDEASSTPLKKSRLDDENAQLIDKENPTIPLDVLKAEALERRNSDPEAEAKNDPDIDENDDHCIICLQSVIDRTVLINCAHDRMCFACIKQWSDIRRLQRILLLRLELHGEPGQEEAYTTAAEVIEQDELDRAIEKRRWVYRYGLFAKHVASNAHTRFRPNPTPQQISNSPELQSRCQMFVRRELRVWPNMDVEFLTNFVLSLVKAIDIRTEAAIKLISEFLDLGGRTSPAGGSIAEHFVHELYSYLRSPFRDLPAYDAVVQYDTPADIEAAPTLPRLSNHAYRDEPGPSRRRVSSFERRRKDEEREKSDPLEASPRDIDSELDNEEDWVEPPPANSKGKGKDDENARDARSRRGDNRRGEVYLGDREGRDGQQSRRNQDSRENRYGDERRSRRHAESHYQDRHHDARYSRSGHRGQYLKSRLPSAYDDTRGGGGQGDNHTDLNGKTNRQRSMEDKRDDDRMERQPRKPAGWDNIFEDDERDQRTISRSARYASSFYPRSRSRSRSRSRGHSPSKRSRSRSLNNRGRRHRRPSPVSPSRHSSSSDSRVPDLAQPLTTSVPNQPKDNWIELATSPEQPTATGPENQASFSGHLSEEGSKAVSKDAVELDVKAQSIARTRPVRLAPMDAIRMHLQGSTRSSGAVSSTKSGDILLPNPEAQVEDQDVVETQKRQSTNSRETTETSTVLGSLSPNRTGKPPRPLVEIFDERTLDGENVSPHVTTSTSDNAPVVSYSIRGAAARPKSQPAPLSSIDSTQRAPSGSPHAPNQSNPARTRLLARLEAAKSVGTISNRDTEASHLARKPASSPTPSETPESPVSTTQIAAAQEEQRLRDIARNRLLRSATNMEGPSPGAPQGKETGHASHQEKTGDPSVPAGDDSPTALNIERRLKLQARLAARKRNITTLMDAASSADAPPRQPSGGIPTVVDRAP
ncbi:hypothetical protein FRC07_005970 [Ceratobasidium sp. 392]|nr:hypothetical protein FRC07_005970 [Ceratobasidium sp. 392]